MDFTRIEGLSPGFGSVATGPLSNTLLVVYDEKVELLDFEHGIVLDSLAVSATAAAPCGRRGFVVLVNGSAVYHPVSARAVDGLVSAEIGAAAATHADVELVAGSPASRWCLIAAGGLVSLWSPSAGVVQLAEFGAEAAAVLDADGLALAVSPASASALAVSAASAGGTFYATLEWACGRFDTIHETMDLVSCPLGDSDAVCAATAPASVGAGAGARGAVFWSELASDDGAAVAVAGGATDTLCAGSTVLAGGVAMPIVAGAPVGAPVLAVQSAGSGASALPELAAAGGLTLAVWGTAGPAAAVALPAWLAPSDVAPGQLLLTALPAPRGGPSVMSLPGLVVLAAPATGAAMVASIAAPPADTAGAVGARAAPAARALLARKLDSAADAVLPGTVARASPICDALLGLFSARAAGNASSVLTARRAAAERFLVDQEFARLIVCAADMSESALVVAADLIFASDSNVESSLRARYVRALLAHPADTAALGRALAVYADPELPSRILPVVAALAADVAACRLPLVADSRAAWRTPLGAADADVMGTLAEASPLSVAGLAAWAGAAAGALPELGAREKRAVAAAREAFGRIQAASSAAAAALGPVERLAAPRVAASLSDFAVIEVRL